MLHGDDRPGRCSAMSYCRRTSNTAVEKPEARARPTAVYARAAGVGRELRGSRESQCRKVFVRQRLESASRGDNLRLPPLGGVMKRALDGNIAGFALIAL